MQNIWSVLINIVEIIKGGRKIKNDSLIRLDFEIIFKKCDKLYSSIFYIKWSKKKFIIFPFNFMQK